jgi:PDZ domain-containing protein
MTQRTLAGLMAVPLLIALWLAAVLLPLPYVTYEPGVTVDVLAETRGHEIIQVQGEKTYRDNGQLRMTTVYVTQPNARVNLFELLRDWISPESSVYPYDAVYQPNETSQQNRQQGAVDMVSSQDAATATALRELGYRVRQGLEVLAVEKGSPADGVFKVRDLFLKVDGRPITSSAQVVHAIASAPPGRPVSFVVRRAGRPVDVSVTPRRIDGRQKIGIQYGTGYRFPFDVSVNIDPAIGGPSAGLMFSLGIYDTLTKGSLTGGATLAGTGTVDGSGRVGPIGGIQQKIAAARAAGAKLFLVPPDNCADAKGAPNGDMRLVKATTMHSAVQSIQAWVDNHRATLPTCGDDS